MFCGMVLIAPYITLHFVNSDLFPSMNGWDLPFTYVGFTVGMVISYVATILIEYPFFHYAIVQNRSFRVSAKITILTNALSYSLIVIVYLIAIHLLRYQ